MYAQLTAVVPLPTTTLEPRCVGALQVVPGVDFEHLLTVVLEVSDAVQLFGVGVWDAIAINVRVLLWPTLQATIAAHACAFF